MREMKVVNVCWGKTQHNIENNIKLYNNKARNDICEKWSWLCVCGAVIYAFVRACKETFRMREIFGFRAREQREGNIIMKENNIKALM